MDSGGQHKNGRHQMEYYRGSHPPWNMISQHQGNEQNALAMNRKIMSIIAEKDAAIDERNLALAEKKEALAARDVAIMQREKAHAERDQALLERDNALAVLQYQESSINFPSGSGMQRGVKRTHLPSTCVTDMDKISNYTGEGHIVDAFPESAKSRKRKKPKESKASLFKSPRKVKKIGEDLNEQVLSDGKKYTSERESQAVGLNLIAFDEATMPGPVCSCTGVPRQCYKWGHGGWQSSCCTTTMSEYPLPQMPNKRHARVGGRKMSGSVFTRLLSWLAAGGHDPSLPLDLKDYWARHGTNRYITIK